MSLYKLLKTLQNNSFLQKSIITLKFIQRSIQYTPSHWQHYYYDRNFRHDDDDSYTSDYNPIIDGEQKNHDSGTFTL